MQSISAEDFLKDFTICITDVINKQKQTRFEITLGYKNKDWAMDKTLAQFNALFKELEKYTYDVGVIEQRVNFKLVPLEEIKKQLNAQLQRLALRKEIIHIKDWRDFMHINNFVTIDNDEILQTFKIQTKSKLSIRDFSYSEKQDIIFCLQVQQKFTKKVTSMLKSLFTQSNTPVAQISLYLKKQFQWSIQFYFKVNCFYWNQKSTMLIVSTIRDVQIYRISVQKDYKHQLFNSIGITQQVINICMSAYNGFIYALSPKALLIIDINKNKIIEQMQSNAQNTSMLINEDTNMLYVAKYPSSVFIYKIQDDSPTPTLLAQIKLQLQGRIKYLTLSFDKIYLIGLTDDGLAPVFEINKGKQKLSQHISSISVPKQSTSISFCQPLKLLFTNYKNNIIVINSMNIPQKSIQCRDKITNVKYIYPSGLIIASDSQGVIHFFNYLPEKQIVPDNPIRKKLPKYEQKDSDQQLQGWTYS